MGMRERE